MLHIPGNEVQPWMWVYHLILVLDLSLLLFGHFISEVRESGRRFAYEMPTWLLLPYVLGSLFGAFWAFPLIGGLGVIILVATMLAMGAPIGAAAVAVGFSAFCWWLMGQCIVRDTPSWPVSA